MECHDNVFYAKNTAVQAKKHIINCVLYNGVNEIKGTCFRKCFSLSSITLVPTLLVIGDAAFAHCKNLKRIIIPGSVEYIGIAAFYSSGLEEITFKGCPKKIENSAFAHCTNLKCVVVPDGTRDFFKRHFDENLITKETTSASKPISDYTPQAGQVVRQPDLFGGGQTVVVQPNIFAPAKPAPSQQVDLFGNRVKRRCKLNYNCREFTWEAGDEVVLSELFSSVPTMYGDPSYQFRRKALFIFMKNKTASGLTNEQQYQLPANVKFFNRKYNEKYGTSKVRILLFTCDDGSTARFLDEVRFVRANENTITVQSQL